jgi:hypothetical protein
MSNNQIENRKRTMETIHDDQSGKELKTSDINNPNQTITFGNKVFNIESKCNDNRLIQRIINNQYLDNGLDFKIECPLQSYIGAAQLGVGAFNTVYSISGMDDKVLRMSNKFYLANQNDGLFFNELAGLFIQAYLSKECPNICKVYDFGLCYVTVKDVKYIKLYAVLEKLSDDLMSFFEGKYGPKPFNTKQWLTLLKDVLTSLECIHKHGYAHLDVKPENMAFNSSGNLCLFDFDTALFFPVEKTIYVSTNLIGTENYLAPELFPPDFRIKAYRKYTRFADIYPLAVILHSCSHYVSDYETYKEIYIELVEKMGAQLKVQSDGKPLIQISENEIGFYAVPLSGRMNATEALQVIQMYEKSHFNKVMGQTVKITGGIKRKGRASRKMVKTQKKTKRRLNQ